MVMTMAAAAAAAAKMMTMASAAAGVAMSAARAALRTGTPRTGVAAGTPATATTKHALKTMSAAAEAAAPCVLNTEHVARTQRCNRSHVVIRSLAAPLTSAPLQVNIFLLCQVLTGFLLPVTLYNPS